MHARADSAAPELPDVLAGPILRRLTPQRLVLWLAASRPLTLRLQLFEEPGEPATRDIELTAEHRRVLAFGAHAHVHLIDIALQPALPEGCVIGYDLLIGGTGAGQPRWRGIAEWAPQLLYPGAERPDFVLHTQLGTVLHGSCRKPHYDSADGLAAADDWLSGQRRNAAQRPALLMLTGDQIYADDVAGPLLATAHALMRRLELWPETIPGTLVADTDALLASDNCYYRREQLLPLTEANRRLLDLFFGGARKPVFTAASAHNHLITLAEMLAMYLLVWSPEPWAAVAADKPALPAPFDSRYEAERTLVDDFVATLPKVRRLLAHVPTYMIFDDHDVTDDWNLSAEWEQAAYEHPFSRRIIGNALIAYLLCQGWGNCPEAFEGDAMDRLQAYCDDPSAATQNALIETLLRLERWQYTLQTTPRLVVLDTRTRRWRSESRLGKPSGLMDWEALSELQDNLLGATSVVLVSPAPIFGVKLIETVQRVFTWIGKPLLVDAENWMAHRGAASVILNIFRHRRTPNHFVILSGDVHYSFVSDVRIRGRRAGPAIWQITSSGLKNEFPPRLLDWFDRLNRWLYHPYSPLNWLTKRRRMLVDPRKPSEAAAGERLVNRSGFGLVRLDTSGRPVDIRQITADGDSVQFPADSAERPAQTARPATAVRSSRSDGPER
jgi:hypothetical protein